MTKIHRNVVSHAVSQLDTYTCTRLVNSTHIPYGSNILALILLTNEIFLPSYSLRVKYSCPRILYESNILALVFFTSQIFVLSVL